MPQNSALTNDELKALFQTPEAPPQGAGGPFPGPGSWVPNLGIGMAKGLGQTIEGGGAMIRRYLPFMNQLPEARLPIDVNPSNYQQQVGSGLEHIGEYALGGSAVPFRAIPQGLVAAGLAGAHSGGDPGTMLGTGIMASLMPWLSGQVANSVPGQAYQKLKSFLQPNAPPSAGNVAGAIPGAATEFTNWRDITPRPGLTPPAPPPGPDQITGSTGQPSLPSGPTAPKQLSPAPRNIVPRGTEPTHGPEANPALPEAYRNIPVGPPPGPGTMGPVKTNTTPLNLGEPGGIPQRGEQTVTPTKVFHISTRDEKTGRFRKVEPAEYEQNKQDAVNAQTNIGRTARELPSAPTPPKKKTPGLKQ